MLAATTGPTIVTLAGMYVCFAILVSEVCGKPSSHCRYRKEIGDLNIEPTATTPWTLDVAACRKTQDAFIRVRRRLHELVLQHIEG